MHGHLNVKLTENIQYSAQRQFRQNSLDIMDNRTLKLLDLTVSEGLIEL
jgi:hypothetical protein